MSGPENSTNRSSTAGHIARTLVAALVLFVFLGGYLTGSLYFVLLFTLPACFVCTFVARVWSAIFKRVCWGFVRHPFRTEVRPQLWQWINRSLSHVAVAAAITLAVPRFALAPAEYIAALLTFAWVPAVLLLLIELFPTRYVSRSLNGVFLVMWLFVAVQMFQLFVVPMWSEKVELSSPVEGEWVVFQGGRSTLLNHHYLLRSQRHALDVVVPDKPMTARSGADPLGSYKTYGQPIFAPADGKVVRVVNDRPDQKIGTTDSKILVGNHVVLEVADDRYVLLAHLKQGSVVVEEGDTIRAGTLIAQCGNSGNTSEPHLHIQVQNLPEWTAKGLETYLIELRGVSVTRCGIAYDEQPGELMRNDLIHAPEAPRSE